MKYTFDPSFPTRPMTTREENIIDHIASQTLFLEKELFFNIGSLLSHTRAVLSGERKTRRCVPDPDEIRKEIEQLEQMSDIPLNETERPEWDLDGRKKALGEILESASVPACAPLLGEFRKDEDTVVLYVNNIDAAAGGNADRAMYLMAYTLIHEYWHSFFHNAGIGTNPAFSCAEEPMAEFGSLVMLDRVLGNCDPSSPVYADLDETLKIAKDEVLSKQQSIGFVAAYGFGYHLYDKHLKDAEQLLAEYANVSTVIDPDAPESLTYRYLVYPLYPSNEQEAFRRLVKMMEAAKLYGFSGPDATLRCTVKRSRLDSFKTALAAGCPYLSNAEIYDAARLYFAMRQHPKVRFSYTKNDGTLRQATGTLMNDILFDMTSSSANHPGGYPTTIDRQSYYDTDRNGWRQFSYDNLMSIDSDIKLTVI